VDTADCSVRENARQTRALEDEPEGFLDDDPIGRRTAGSSELCAVRGSIEKGAGKNPMHR
jgi:hypothetical protein